MAIVFISPKAKQRLFFRLATITITLSLIVFVLVTIITGFVTKSVPKNLPLQQQDITINLGVIDSPQVKNLEPFTVLETEFSYTVEDKDGKQVQGNISAATKEDAQKLLEDSGMKVISLQEANLGNSQPFVAY